MQPVPSPSLHVTRHPARRSRALPVVLAACLLVPLVIGAFEPSGRSDVSVTIQHVRVVHGDGRVTVPATVTIRDGTIAAVTHEDAGQVAQPSGRVLDGTGLTLLPGFIDAHVRLEAETMHTWLAFGVTTVRHIAGETTAGEASGDPRGRPRVVAVGGPIDGPGAPREAVVVETVGAAREAVRMLAEGGSRTIAIGPRVAPALLPVVAAEARARALGVAANPGTVPATVAAELGVTSIEHLGGVAAAASADPGPILAASGDGDRASMMERLEWRHLPLHRLEDVARQLASTDVVLVPVLAAREAEFRVAGAADGQDLAGEVLAQYRQAFPLVQQFVGTFARVGGRIVAGSGAGEPGVTAGAGLHRELELLVACGLSPGRAIVAATGDAASVLGLKDQVGTIDPGKTADLVLVAGNPLTDIRATRRIVSVFHAGVQLPVR